MPAEVKICGLTTPETVAAALGAGADWIGLNVFAPSPRYLAPALLRALAAHAPAGRTVAILVDPDDALIDAVAPAVAALQLHGSEPPARLAAIRARVGKPVWRAVGVASRADLAVAAAAARGVADRLLLDAKAPAGAALPGGNGVRFDWALLAGFAPGLEWGLSGGLDPSNVGQAIAQSRAPLVDVSSGVEDAPGVKSLSKIAAFIAAARA